MVDAYFIGHLVGRLLMSALMSALLVYVAIFIFSKCNLQVASRRMKTVRAALVTGLVVVLPLLADIGASIS